MEIKQQREGNRLIIYIIGDLNTITAPDLEAVLLDQLADVEELIMDLSEMNYTSSAGLRAFLMAQQDMDDKNGSMVIRGANDLVMEIFEETGFDTFLDIEE